MCASVLLNQNVKLVLKALLAICLTIRPFSHTELPKLGRHYEPEALDQFLPWVMTEKIPPLK
jgi:hypothetical protein